MEIRPCWSQSEGCFSFWAESQLPATVCRYVMSTYWHSGPIVPDARMILGAQNQQPRTPRTIPDVNCRGSVLESFLNQGVLEACRSRTFHRHGASPMFPNRCSSCRLSAMLIDTRSCVRFFGCLLVGMYVCGMTAPPTYRMLATIALRMPDCCRFHADDVIYNQDWRGSWTP